MTKATAPWRLAAIAAVLCSLACWSVPYASADSISGPTITITNATGACPSGGVDCTTNTTAISLSALENESQTLQSTTGDSFLVTNDTGSSVFSLAWVGTLQTGQPLNCVEAGTFSSDACSVSENVGLMGTQTYIPPPGMPGIFTFTGPSSGTFDIIMSGFTNGNEGELTGMPESSSFAMFATDLLVLFGIVGLLGKRRSNKEA